MAVQVLNHELFETLCRGLTPSKLMVALHEKPGQTLEYYLAKLEPKLQVGWPKESVNDAMKRFLRKGWVRREKVERGPSQRGGIPYRYWPLVGKAEIDFIRRGNNGKL